MEAEETEGTCVSSLELWLTNDHRLSDLKWQTFMSSQFCSPDASPSQGEDRAVLPAKGKICIAFFSFWGPHTCQGSWSRNAGLCPHLRPAVSPRCLCPLYARWGPPLIQSDLIWTWLHLQGDDCQLFTATRDLGLAYIFEWEIIPSTIRKSLHYKDDWAPAFFSITDDCTWGSKSWEKNSGK